MGNDTSDKQGDDCHGVSVVDLPADMSNSTVQKHTPEAPDQKARVACGHYLAGAVTGPLLHTNLKVAGETVRESQVLFADRLYARGNITLHSFAQYYGGAVGVQGMGLYEPMYDAESLLHDEKQFSSEIVGGILRNLWLQQDSTINRSSADLNSTAASNKIWSMALPRWDNGEEADGRLVIGGLVSNETAETTGHELTVPLSPYAEDEGHIWKKSYAFDRVAFSIGNSSVDVAQEEEEEEYFVDSAMPIIYTSHPLAAEVASLVSPSGVYDKSTGLFAVNCSGTAPSEISFNIDNGRGGQLHVPMYPGDLIVPWPLDNKAGGSCMSGFQNHHGQPEWRRLEWPFFRNVVLTVDVGQWEANISARAWPEKPPASPTTSSSTSTTLTSSPTSLPPPGSISPSTITTRTTKLITTIQTTSLPNTTPRLSTSIPPTSDSSGGISVSPIEPSSDTLSISFPKTITASPSTPAAGQSDSFVSPSPVSTSSDGPAGFHKWEKQEDEARSVADEESGIKGWWADRRGRARARARDGMGGRWWPVRLVRRRSWVRGGGS